jgi:hypothetical protein
MKRVNNAVSQQPRLRLSEEVLERLKFETLLADLSARFVNLPADQKDRFYNVEGLLISLPARWTSAVARDPVVTMAAGRCRFRVGTGVWFLPTDVLPDAAGFRAGGSSHSPREEEEKDGMPTRGRDVDLSSAFCPASAHSRYPTNWIIPIGFCGRSCTPARLVPHLQ